MAAAKDEEKLSAEVQKIVDEGNAQMKDIVKKAMKTTFADYNDDKIEEYSNNLLSWDNQFDEKDVDPARIINGWIEVILKLKVIKKELKKKEKDEEKRNKQLKKKMKKALITEYKKEFLTDNLKKNKAKLSEDDVKGFADTVFKWHNDVLGKDVNKFVKTWVDVESKLQPIRDKVFKNQIKQEDKEYEIEKKKAVEEAEKKREEDRIKWEKEREEKKKERERLKKEEEARKKKEEEERKAREAYEKKPKFYKSPKKLTGKAIVMKTADKMIEYVKKTKGTQFVIMYEARNGKKLMEYLKPNYIDKYCKKYHFIKCKMDNDLTKAAKVWFNAWDMYTINQYPCFCILLNGRGTVQEHIFFTNFEDGCKKLEALFDDCVHLKYDKKAIGY